MMLPDVLHSLNIFLLCVFHFFSTFAYSQPFTATSDLQRGSPWPAFNRNQYGIAQSPFTGPLNPVVLWGYDSDPNSTLSSMTIDLSGNVYTCSDVVLYVLDPDIGVIKATVDLEFGM